jgi:hypothetical protein
LVQLMDVCSMSFSCVWVSARFMGICSIHGFRSMPICVPGSGMEVSKSDGFHSDKKKVDVGDVCVFICSMRLSSRLKSYLDLRRVIELS